MEELAIRPDVEDVKPKTYMGREVTLTVYF